MIYVGKNKSRGFTLAEAIAVMVIIATLVALAIPAFKNLRMRDQATSITSRLADSFRLARIYALNTGKDVTICPTNNDTPNICNTNNSWNGWSILFKDTNELIRKYGDIPTGSVISESLQYVTYGSSGFPLSGEHFFTIQPQGCRGKNARSLKIKATGSIYIDADDCNE